jgi:hypothetical protein
MSKHVGWAAAAVLALGALAGCGDSTDAGNSTDAGDTSEEASATEPENSTEAYCERLTSVKDAFTSFEEGNPTQYSDAIDRLRDLGGQAPEEISDDWQTMVGAMDGLEAAVEDAGLSFDDLATLGEGPLPEGVTAEDIAKLQTDLEAFDSSEIDKAGDDIAAHAKSECGVDIEDGSTS